MKRFMGSFGPRPWHQTAWDWRAATNFICGGIGSGLLAFATLSHALGLPAPHQTLFGAILVGAGLFAVWLEIGRPLRALHVFFHPKRSWMSREAFVAALLLPSALAAVLGAPGFAWLAGALALVFVYCQARILKAAKGIPAWRQPLVVPLIVATALAEGGGLWLVSAPLHGTTNLAASLLAGAAVGARWAVWLAYRRQLAGQAAPKALDALDKAAKRLQHIGTLAPLLLIAAAAGLALAAGRLDAPLPQALAALGGLGAVAGGICLKFTLITRAAFNQGFALAKLPVRGVPRPR